MMKGKRFETEKGSISYWVGAAQPDRPWLVFLPGLSADHTLFERQIAFFEHRYNCFVWDAPAHGCSRPFELTFSMEDMAAYLHEIFKTEGIEKPVLVGQSLGGYISQTYMDLYPASVCAFVSIDSCSMSRKYYSAWELWLLKRTGWMYLNIPWKLLLKWGVWGTAKTSYGRALMEKMWSVYEREEYCALADHGFRIFAQAVEKKEEYPIECPVLLLCGEKDAAGSAKRYNRRWTREDGHSLVWIRGAGHNANTDAPEQVNHLIEEFVNSI